MQSAQNINQQAIHVEQSLQLILEKLYKHEDVFKVILEWYSIVVRNLSTQTLTHTRKYFRLQRFGKNALGINFFTPKFF